MHDLLLTQPDILEEQINLLLIAPATWLQDIKQHFLVDSINAVTRMNVHKCCLSYHFSLNLACQELRQRNREFSDLLAIVLSKVNELTDIDGYYPNNEIIRSFIGTAIISLQNTYLCKLSYINNIVAQEMQKLQGSLFANRNN